MQTCIPKFITALQAGTGAPDICDVEVGQFPNVVAGKDEWLVPLDDYMTEYKDSMVPARLDVYSGDDGKIYGAPYHVGATVMYYNVKAMADAMGISNDDVIAKSIMLRHGMTMRHLEQNMLKQPEKRNKILDIC